MRHPIPFCAAILFATLAEPLCGEPVRYNRDVRPILSDNCFACHGPDSANQKSGLRLDAREVAMKPAKSGDPVIVPGEVDASALVARSCFRGIVPSFAREVLIHSGDPHVLSDGTEARHFRGRRIV